MLPGLAGRAVYDGAAQNHRPGAFRERIGNRLCHRLADQPNATCALGLPACDARQGLHHRLEQPPGRRHLDGHQHMTAYNQRLQNGRARGTRMLTATHFTRYARAAAG